MSLNVNTLFSLAINKRANGSPSTRWNRKLVMRIIFFIHYQIHRTWFPVIAGEIFPSVAVMSMTKI